MRFKDLDTLSVLKEIAYHVQCRAKLSCFLWWRIDRDNREIFMLPGWFAAQRHATSSRAVSSTLHSEPSDEERSRINLEVGHYAIVVGGRWIRQ